MTRQPTQTMFAIVLYQPEIPPNTGNIIRLCANSGTELHLVEPLGFSLNDAQLRRAGLDYHEYARIQVHPDWAACREHFNGRRLLAMTTKASERFDQIEYRKGDVFMFGPESRGLPAEILSDAGLAERIRLPMLPGQRSLNLSNAAAVTLYEAWRQHGYAGSV